MGEDNNKDTSAQWKKAVIASTSRYVVGEPVDSASRPTLIEELERSQKSTAETFDRAGRALVFLRANPAFDEFIQLIRSGVISLY